MTSTKKFSIYPIFLLMLIDMIGIGIIIPIMAPMFIQSDLFFNNLTNINTRLIMLGLLIASYPLAQFFGAPILGALSDKHGRKKLIITSLCGSILGYILFAISIIIHNLPLLFISRIIQGFTGGNISIAMSSIADISSEEEKPKRFGLIGMAFGIGIIIGPFIGGILSNSNIISWFNYSTPIWFAAFLSAMNLLLFIYNFEETHLVRSDKKISMLTGFLNIKKAFTYKDLRIMFLYMMLLSFGFSFFTQFFQVFLIQKFSYTSSQIGTYFGILGMCIALTQGLIVRPISKKYKSYNILKITTIGMGIIIALMLIPKNPSGLYILMPLLAIFNGLTFPNSTALVSNIAPKESQGEILGINQSFQSLGMAIPPLISGIIAAVAYYLPIIIGSILIIIAGIMFIIFFDPKLIKQNS